MFFLDSSFLLKLILLLVILFLLIYAFDRIMRKILKVEKEKFLFSYGHVNKKHKIIDWAIRGAIIVMMLVGFFINVNRDPVDWILYLQPWFILVIGLSIQFVVRAGMEKKYAKNPNAYKLTSSQLIFMIILFFIILRTDFFGL